MVGIVTGNEQGLLTGSLTLLNGGGAVGQANLGRQGEQVYLNASTGNLVIQNRDELLINQGLDAALVRTYNSQGQFTDDNGDNFRIGFNKRLTNIPATPNTAGTSITRINADGSESLYNYDETQGVYITSDGSGADDTLSFNNGNWTWTEGSSRITETYDANGQLQNSRDADGNTTAYIYDTTGRLTQVNDASGQSVNLIYTGINLTSIQTVTPEGSQTRVRYGYDTSNRLTQVTVDLTPEDSSIADGNTYVTTYTYDGSSKRIASITQGDGNTISFTYDASDRVATYTDGVGRTTNIQYNIASQDIINTASANAAVLDTQISTDYALNNTLISTTDTDTDTETVTTDYALNGGALSTTEVINETLTVTASNDSKLQSIGVQDFTYSLDGTSLVVTEGVSLAPGLVNLGDTTPTSIRATLYRGDGRYYRRFTTDVGYIQQGYYIGETTAYDEALGQDVTTPAHFSETDKAGSLGAARKHIAATNYDGHINLGTTPLPPDTYRVVIDIRDDADADWRYNNQLIDGTDGRFSERLTLYVTVGTDLNPTTLTVPPGTQPAHVTQASVQYRLAGSDADYSTASVDISADTHIADLGGLAEGDYEYTVQYSDAGGTPLKTVRGIVNVGIGGTTTTTASASITVAPTITEDLTVTTSNDSVYQEGGVLDHAYSLSGDVLVERVGIALAPGVIDFIDSTPTSISATLYRGDGSYYRRAYTSTGYTQRGYYIDEVTAFDAVLGQDVTTPAHFSETNEPGSLGRARKHVQAGNFNGQINLSTSSLPLPPDTYRVVVEINDYAEADWVRNNSYFDDNDGRSTQSEELYITVGEDGSVRLTDIQPTVFTVPAGTQPEHVTKGTIQYRLAGSDSDYSTARVDIDTATHTADLGKLVPADYEYILQYSDISGTGLKTFSSILSVGIGGTTTSTVSAVVTVIPTTTESLEVTASNDSKLQSIGVQDFTYTLDGTSLVVTEGVSLAPGLVDLGDTTPTSIRATLYRGDGRYYRRFTTDVGYIQQGYYIGETTAYDEALGQDVTTPAHFSETDKAGSLGAARKHIAATNYDGHINLGTTPLPPDTYRVVIDIRDDADADWRYNNQLIDGTDGRFSERLTLYVTVGTDLNPTTLTVPPGTQPAHVTQASVQYRLAGSDADYSTASVDISADTHIADLGGLAEGDYEYTVQYSDAGGTPLKTVRGIVNVGIGGTTTTTASASITVAPTITEDLTVTTSNDSVYQEGGVLDHAYSLSGDVLVERVGIALAPGVIDFIDSTPTSISATLYRGDGSYYRRAYTSTGYTQRGYYIDEVTAFDAVLGQDVTTPAHFSETNEPGSLGRARKHVQAGNFNGQINLSTSSLPLPPDTYRVVVEINDYAEADWVRNNSYFDDNDGRSTQSEELYITVGEDGSVRLTDIQPTVFTVPAGTQPEHVTKGTIQYRLAGSDSDYSTARVDIDTATHTADLGKLVPADYEYILQYSDISGTGLKTFSGILSVGIGGTTTSTVSAVVTAAKTPIYKEKTTDSQNINVLSIGLLSTTDTETITTDYALNGGALSTTEVINEALTVTASNASKPQSSSVQNFAYTRNNRTLVTSSGVSLAPGVANIGDTTPTQVKATLYRSDGSFYGTTYTDVGYISQGYYIGSTRTYNTSTESYVTRHAHFSFSYSSESLGRARHHFPVTNFNGQINLSQGALPADTYRVVIEVRDDAAAGWSYNNQLIDQRDGTYVRTTEVTVTVGTVLNPTTLSVPAGTQPAGVTAATVQYRVAGSTGAYSTASLDLTTHTANLGELAEGEYEYLVQYQDAAGTVLKTVTGTTSVGIGGTASSTGSASATVAAAPYYEVKSGDTFSSIAQTLYGTSLLADELQATLGNPSLIAGTRFTDLPVSLTDTVINTITVPAYYTVQANDSFNSIAQYLYGSSLVGDELQTAVGNPVLTAGSRLAALQGSLTNTVTVAPYYTVQSGDTFSSIAEVVYGTASAGSALQAALGNPALTVGTRLTVPASLDYVTEVITSSSTNVADASGAITRYAYDTDGRLTDVITPPVDGKTTSVRYTYDARDNVTQTTDGLGNTVDYVYDANSNLVLQRDSEGNTLTRSYNGDNQLVTETLYTGIDTDGAGPQLPSGAQTSRYVYDSESHLRFSISAEGRVTELRYDAVGNQTSAITYTSGTYNLAGLSATDTLNETQLLAFVATADKTQSQRIDNAYDFRGQLASTTTYTDVDANGNGILNAQTSVTQYIYDAFGNLKQTLDGNANRTDYVYDGLNRLTVSTDANGVQTTTVYDDVNYTIATTLANGLVTTSAYNNAGELVSVLQSDVNTAQSLGTTTYAYDAAGNLRHQTDPTGITTYQLYDARNRLVADIDADGSVTERVYDAADNLVQSIAYATRIDTAQLINPDGSPADVDINAVRPANTNDDRTFTTVYDSANRAVLSYDSIGAVAQTLYDGAGRVTDVIQYATAIDTNGLTATRTPSDVIARIQSNVDDRHSRSFYDADSNLVGQLDAAGYLVEYRYDDAGQQTETVAYANAAAQAVRSSGDFSAIQGSIASSADDIHSYALYNARGDVIATVDGEGYLTETVYDANGNVSTTIAYANKANAYTSSASVSDLRPASDPQDRVSTYTYTALNQLDTSTNAEGTVTQYTYDEVGNVISTTVAVGTTTSRTGTTEYDVQGRVIAELSPEGSEALKSAVTQTDIDAVWDVYALNYAYDTAGRRISITDQNDNTTLLFYNDDGQLSHSVNARGEAVRTTYNSFGQVVETLTYANRIDTTGLTGGQVTQVLVDSLVEARDLTRDTLTKTEYSVTGAVSRAIDALGNASETTYDTFGQLSSLRDANGVLSQYVYDKRGQSVQSVRDAGGLNQSTAQTFDAFGRVISSIDAKGNATEASYDRRGQIVETRDATNANAVTTFDAFGQVLSVTNSLGQVTRYEYDQALRSVTITSPEGVQTQTVRNEFGEEVVVTDGNGNATTFSYNRNGELTSVTDAKGNATQTEYDAGGLTTAFTDARGVRTVYTYDAANRLASSTLDPDGLALTTTYKYNTKGQTVLTTDPAGQVTRTRYDVNGQQISVSVDPDGLNLTTEYAYDAVGQLLTVSNGAGTPEVQVTQYAYDNLGRRTSTVVDPSGLAITTQYEFDANDNVVRATDANGDVTRYVYDENDRLVYAIDALGGVNQTVYDSAGKVVQTIRYANQLNTAVLPATLTTSGVNSLIQAATGDDRVQTSIYDNDGRLIFSRDALGNITESVYDNAGNVVKRIAYANPVADLTVNTLSGIRSALQADAARDRTGYAVYNSLNQQVYDVDVYGAVTEYRYDANGNVIDTTLYANSIDVSLANNNPNALSDIGTQLSLIANANEDRSVRSIFDAANREIYTVDAKGFVVESTYDAVGRNTGSVVYDAAVSLGVEPTVAAVQLAIDESDPDNRTTRIGYDNAGRVVLSVDAEDYTEVNTYDAVGNRLTYTNAKGDTFTYAYDALGRVTSETTPKVTVNRLTEVAPGNVTSVSSEEAIVVLNTYDNLGNVISRTEAAGTPDTRTTTYVYDALGRQVQTIFPEVGVYNAAADQAAAYAGRNETLANPTATTTYDSFGNAVANVDVNGARAYKIYDQAGRLIFDVDAEGFVIEYSYDAFGNQGALTRHGVAISVNPENYPQGLSVADVASLLASAEPDVTVSDEIEIVKLPPTQPYSYSESATTDTETQVTSVGGITTLPIIQGQSSIVQEFAYARSNFTLVTTAGVSIAPGNVSIGDTTPTQVKATLYRGDGSFYGTTYTDVGYSQKGYYIGSTTKYNTATESYTTTPAHFSTRYDYSSESIARAYRYLPVSNFNGQINLSHTSLPADTYRVVVEVRDDAARRFSNTNTFIDQRDGTYVHTTELFVTVGTVVSGATLSIPQSEQPAGTSVDFLYRAAGSTGAYQSGTLTSSGNNNVVTVTGQQPGDYEYLLQYADSFGKVVKTGTGTFTVSATAGSAATNYITPTRDSVTAAGSSISGYVSAGAAASIDYFATTVKDAETGAVVSTATTYPEVISNYSGQVNLSTGQVLADGQYTVEITQHNRDGSQSLDSFYYEVGGQPVEKLISSIDFNTGEQPANTTVRVRYAPVGSPTYITADGNVTEDGYNVTLINQPTGNYNYILDYLDAGNTVVATSTGTFAVSEGGTTAADTRTVITEYDQRGKIARVITPSTFNFDSSAAAEDAHFNSEGISTNFYNASGQIVKQSVLKNALTGTTVDSYFYYDTRGNQTASIDGLGYLSEYEYDASGEVTRITEYAQSLVPGSYDENGYSGVVSTTPQNTLGSAIGYDRITEIGYDKLGQKISETRVNVEHSEATYGGVVNTTTQFGDLTTRYGYDAVGNLISTTDAGGNTTYTYYDALGRTIGIAEPARLSEDASGGALPTVSVTNGILRFDKPQAGNTQVNLQYAVANTGVFTTAALIDRGDRYQVNVKNLANDYYDYRLTFTRPGDSTPYARGEGQFTVTGQSSAGSQNVVAATLEPVVSLKGFSSAHIVSDESGTYYVGSSRVSLDISSLSDYGEGEGRVTVYYTARNGYGQTTTGSETTTLSERRTGVNVFIGSGSDIRSYQTITSVNRIVVEKNTGTQYVTIHDTSGDSVAYERLVLQGATAGLTGINVSGVGVLATTAIGDGLYEIDISQLSSGQYTYTPIGTASSVSGSFEVRGGATNLSVLEGYHGYTQKIIEPAIVEDEDGSRFRGAGAININYASLEQYGGGDIRVVVDYAASDVRNRSVNRTINQTFSAADALEGARLTINDGYNKITEIKRVQIFKVIDGNEVKIRDRRSDSDSGDIEISGVPASAADVVFEYRIAGEDTAYLSKTTSSTGPGWFAVAYDDLANNSYEYRVSVKDSSGNPVNLSAIGGNVDGTLTGILDIKRGGDSLTSLVSGDVNTLTPLTTVTHDIFGNAVSITRHANGAASATAQDKATNGNSGFVVAAADAENDQTTHAFFDAFGNKVTDIDAEGGVINTSYNADGNVAKTWQVVTDIDGNTRQITTLFDYDGLGQQVSTTQVLEGGVLASEQVQYNAHGEITAKGLNGDFQEYYEYDAAGRLVRTNEETGIDRAYLYNLAGQATSEIRSAELDLSNDKYSSSSYLSELNEGVQRRESVFDDLGRVIEQRQPTFVVNSATGDTRVSPTIQQILDRYGNVLSVTDPRNASFTALYRYDYANNVIEERLPEADVFNEQAIASTERPTTTYAYDHAGRQLSVTDGNGHTSGQRYDAAGQVVGEYSATGSVTTHTYNTLGQRVASVDANKNITNYTYDRNDQVTTQSTPLLIETYVYDEEGNRIRVTNAKGESTDTFYDVRGNVVSTRLAGGQRSTISYDLRNNRLVDTDANGRTITRNVDAFGRLLSLTDLGNVETRYAYNFNGQAVSQESDRGQNISYEYYENGQIKRILDNTYSSETFYVYDAAGNTVQERYTQGGTVYQDANTTYDALGRVTQVQDKEFTLNYGYDSVGNRRFTQTSYTDNAGALQTNSNYYLYDADNRITVSKGVLNGTSIEIDSTQGIDISYDAAGNRRIARFYEGNNLVEESYVYDANNRLTSTNRAGLLTSARSYDDAGRVVEYSSFSNPGQLTERKTSTYNSNGQLLRQNIYDTTGHVAVLSYDLAGSYDAAGNILKYSLETVSGTRTVNTYTYNYLYQDSYKESSISGKRTIYYSTGAASSTGVTNNTYDKNGNLIRVTDSKDSANNQTFVNNQQGQILRKTQNGKSQNYYYADGKAIGSQGELSDADFDYNYTPVNDSYPALTPSSYVVSSGDNLQSIARAVYGDASLWYIIADANALRSDADLVAGQTLKIPNSISNINNNTDTFKPYNAGEIIGDTTPTLPDAPPPPKKDKCGGFGAILVVIVTIVVSIIVPPALGLGPVTASLNAAIVGAAAGNIAGQIVGNIAGIQDGFDFKSFASTVLTAGLTHGVGTDFFKGLEGLEIVAARNIIGQGVNIITGQQDGFNFKSFVSSVVGAKVSSVVGNKVAGLDFGEGNDFLKDFTVRFAQNAASEVVRIAVNGGGKFQFANVAANAFGNALGNSIAREIAPVSTRSSRQSSSNQPETGTVNPTSNGELFPIGIANPTLEGEPVSAGNSSVRELLGDNRESGFGIAVSDQTRGFGFNISNNDPFYEYTAQALDIRFAQLSADLQLDSDIDQLTFNSTISELRDSADNGVPIFALEELYQDDPIRLSALRTVLQETLIDDQLAIQNRGVIEYTLQPGELSAFEATRFAFGGAVRDFSRLLYEVKDDPFQLALDTGNGLLQVAGLVSDQTAYNLSFGYFGNNNLNNAISLYGDNVVNAFNAGDNERLGSLFSFLPGLAVGGAGTIRGFGLASEVNTLRVARGAAYNNQTVTIYRVDDNNFDLRILSDGSIPVVTTKNGNERALFVNIGQPQRAKEFAQVNRNGNATITAVEADASILERLRSTSVHDLSPDAALNPTAPLRVDINKAPDQFGLRTSEQIQMLRDAIEPLTVRIIEPDDL